MEKYTIWQKIKIFYGLVRRTEIRGKKSKFEDRLFKLINFREQIETKRLKKINYASVTFGTKAGRELSSETKFARTLIMNLNPPEL